MCELEEANPSMIMTSGWVRGREAVWDTPEKAEGSGGETAEHTGPGLET